MAPFLTNDNGAPGADRQSKAKKATGIEGMGITAERSHSPKGLEHGVDTEFLIAGAGPAGASLACFLGSHGLKGIMISSAPGTANTPRAHITNMAALGQWSWKSWDRQEKIIRNTKPHAWLNKATPRDPISTIDIACHGMFTLLSGIGGGPWKKAAEMVAETLKVPIQVHSIGFRQDWEDVYFEWESLRGVEESGAVLVRPDRFVAWRAPEVLQDTGACASKLLIVMRTILGFVDV
ncbi:FAD binding domain-containing protein [Penicillium daleae]|uniref:FAD binding domain-containing protein n=1 Tax=Penicillium daleae TaxID=63821 RepID=A0AAD6CG92_9EURO|nr:FAD binding domain-containing protein [Penicillium daleae]KAJ5464808.1 FAD binding domain-containing protein [Penicillium daleae]